MLPPIGQEISCSGYAVNVPLQINVLGLITLDFRGGVRYHVKARQSGGLGGVTLEITGEEYSADSPVLGKVTLSHSENDATPLSLLEVTSKDPDKYRNTVFHDFTLTIEKPPGGGGPMTLANTKTMTTLAETLTTFPPQRAVYQLQQPVDFAPVDSPDQVVAQLLQFPVTMEGS